MELAFRDESDGLPLQQLIVRIGGSLSIYRNKVISCEERYFRHRRHGAHVAEGVVGRQ